MSTVAISKRYGFEAAHRLKHLPPEHQCSRPHGHSYQVEVELCWKGDGPPPAGWVVDYGEIDRSFGAWVKDTLDHRDLNEVFAQLAPELPTTAECLAYVLWGVMARQVTLAPYLRAVRVSETAKTWAEFRG